MFVKHYVDMMYKVSRKLRTPIEVFNSQNQILLEILILYISNNNLHEAPGKGFAY